MHAEVRYLSPHRRKGGTLENVAREITNAAMAIVPQRIFPQTNLLAHRGAYKGGLFFQWRPGGHHATAYRRECQ